MNNFEKIILDKKLSPTEKIILFFLKMQKKNNLIYSSRELEKQLNISNPTISTNLKKLQKKNFMKISKITKGSSGKFYIKLKKFIHIIDKSLLCKVEQVSNPTNEQDLHFLSPLEKHKLYPLKFPHPLGNNFSLYLKKVENV